MFPFVSKQNLIRFARSTVQLNEHNERSVWSRQTVVRFECVCFIERNEFLCGTHCCRSDVFEMMFYVLFTKLKQQQIER